MDTKISTAIADVLSDVIERPVANIAPEARFDKDFDLDSYMFVQFLLSLEDKIPGLRFDPETIGQAGFNTMESLVAHVTERATPAEVGPDA